MTSWRTCEDASPRLPPEHSCGSGSGWRVHAVAAGLPHRILSFVPLQVLKVGAVVVTFRGCSARSELLSASWSPEARTPLSRTQLEKITPAVVATPAGV